MLWGGDAKGLGWGKGKKEGGENCEKVYCVLVKKTQKKKTSGDRIGRLGAGVYG